MTVTAIQTGEWQVAVDAARLRRGWRVLDVGCGTGESALIAADLVGRRGLVVGMDVDAVAIAAATDSARERREVTFLCDDALNHPFEPASFDAVISHLGPTAPGAADAIVRLARLVAARGRLSVVTGTEPGSVVAALESAGFADVRVTRLDGASACSGTRDTA